MKGASNSCWRGPFGALPLDLLDIQGLTTRFFTRAGVIKAVDNLSLKLQKGRVLGLVGESGCGKTVTALSILNLVPPPGRIVAGKIVFDGQDLLTLPPEEMRAIRGARISMIFQEPMTALNPVFTVGNQIAEVLITHQDSTKKDAMASAVELLRSVGIPSPEKRVHEYPHQLSGGMRQRVMIAMAIACKPSLILADEPTTALDVTIQAHILELLGRIQAEMGMALVLVTHDLGLIAERSHEVAVMYAGRIVEQAETRELFADPRHPYTRGLMDSIPKPGEEGRKRLRTIIGSVPQLHDLPKGCAFAPRCDRKTAQCETAPELVEVTPGHLVRCWNAA
jgi:oligopeptide/dipeptide ABC transporter ATP-binding protein